MRFRAELFDSTALSGESINLKALQNIHFLMPCPTLSEGILSSLEKISNDVYIILDREFIHFRIVKQSASEEQVFVQIQEVRI